jgi:catechol 2,3-dioxygenase-like lactoylglutathione lyase family enzyme
VTRFQSAVVGGAPRLPVGALPTAVTFGAPGARSDVNFGHHQTTSESDKNEHIHRRTPIFKGGVVLDHIYISVQDIPRSLRLFAATLEPLGWREIGSYDSSAGPADVPDLYGLADEAYGSGEAIGSSIWLRRRQSGETGLYVGFVADSEAEVNAAYTAALSAGATNEGEPAVREYFGPRYYAANIGDFDGNQLEIVHKSFNPPSRRRPE